MHGRGFVLGLLLVIGILIVYHWPVFVSGRDYYNSDHNYYFEPFSRYLRQAFEAGRIAMWNPHCYCGMSQLANPSPGMFFFPNWLFFCLPYSKALSGIIAFHQLIGYVAGFALLSVLGLGVEACFIGGLCLALNGYMFSLTSNYTLPATAAFGLLALFAFFSLISRPTLTFGQTIWPRARYLYFFLGALSTHWMLMAGRPEIYVPFCIIYGLVILALVAMPRLLHLDGMDEIERKKDRLRLGAAIAAAIIVGIMLSLPSLLPVFEWTMLSPRSKGLNLEQVFHWSANWYDFFGMIYCQPLGDLQRPGLSLAPLVATRAKHYPFLASAYLGPIVATYFIFGFASQRKRLVWLLFGLGLLAACFAMGKYGPLSLILLKNVPLFTVLRYPVKLMVLVILAAATIAAIGFDAFTRGQIKKPLVMRVAVMWAIIALWFGAMHFWPQILADLFKHPRPDFFAVLGQSCAPVSLIGLFACLLMFYSDKLKLDQKALNLCLAACLIGSMVVPAMRFGLSLTEPGFFLEPSYLAGRFRHFARDMDKDPDRALRVVSLYFDPLRVPSSYDYLAKCGMKSAPAANNMQYARQMLLPNSHIDSHVYSTFGYEAAETALYRRTFLDAFHKCAVDENARPAFDPVMQDREIADFCRMTSTELVSTQSFTKTAVVKKLNPAYFDLLEDSDADTKNSMNVRIYRVRSFLPRMFVADRVVLADSEEEAIKLTMQSDKKIAVVEKEKRIDCERNGLLLQLAAWMTASPIADQSMESQKKALGTLPLDYQSKGDISSRGSEIALVKDEPENVTIGVKMESPGFVVLNDRYYPGWQLKIDSLPASFYRTNGFMRGLYLDKGSHSLEFEYMPSSFLWGIILFALAFSSALGMLAMFLFAPCKRAFDGLCGKI